jgi:hypothetical protein
MMSPQNSCAALKLLIGHSSRERNAGFFLENLSPCLCNQVPAPVSLQGRLLMARDWLGELVRDWFDARQRDRGRLRGRSGYRLLVEELEPRLVFDASSGFGLPPEASAFGLVDSLHAPAELTSEATLLAAGTARVDVNNLIHVRNEQDAQEVRRKLMQYVWQADHLPTALPTITTNETPPLANLPNFQSCDVWYVQVSDDFGSYLYHLKPKSGATNNWIIVHQGHSNDFESGNIGYTARRFLAVGWNVLLMGMPAFVGNPAPVPLDHNVIPLYETETFSGMRPFLDPVIVGINQIQQHAPGRIAMTGVSGGGWTTHLAAAIDVRIQDSFPVAGSLPTHLRTSTELGDWEQLETPGSIYGVANYLDLYALAAFGQNRRQIQILNVFDSCCFAGHGHKTYANLLSDLTGDQFQVFADVSHHDHVISSLVLERIIMPGLRPPPPPTPPPSPPPNVVSQPELAPTTEREEPLIVITRIPEQTAVAPEVSPAPLAAAPPMPHEPCTMYSVPTTTTHSMTDADVDSIAALIDASLAAPPGSSPVAPAISPATWDRAEDLLATGTGAPLAADSVRSSPSDTPPADRIDGWSGWPLDTLGRWHASVNLLLFEQPNPFAAEE